MAIPVRFSLILMRQRWNASRQRWSRMHSIKSCWRSSRVKRALPAVASRCMFMPISAALVTWPACWRTMPRASAFSAVNLFTWKARIIRQRSSSLKSISWQRKQWPASVLLSVRLISALISRLITSSCRRRKIRRWVIAQSVSVWKDRSCLLLSCVLSAALLLMASWQ